MVTETTISSIVISMLMMLAFLVDQYGELACAVYQAVRTTSRTKYNLWEATRTFFLHLDLSVGWRFFYRLLLKEVSPFVDST